MSKWKTASFAVTEEENELIRECTTHYSNSKNTDITVNKFLRLVVLSYLKNYQKKFLIDISKINYL